ncbi:MAG: hypothetical protein QOE60_2802, partial [Thermoleophilaceae bacterium]|nr:hypothetical protein [Thermoleophilaceae bacterium]
MRLFGRKKPVLDAPPTYWNSAVVERIQRDASVDREAATALWSEMLLFLDMVAVSKEFVSPPPQVDIAWHAFILHTRDYEAYCRERYGRSIHHQPTGAPDPQAYQRAYQARSASPMPVDPMIWPVPIGVTVPGDGGGGDSRPGQSGDFAAGAATIGGAELGTPDGAIQGGDFDGRGGDSGGDIGGGDFGG